MKKFWKKTEGFTLVELIVVIAILGILAGVGTVGYSGYVKKANMAADRQLVDYINQAYAIACVQNGVDAKNTIADSISIINKKMNAMNVNQPADKADKIEDSFNLNYPEHADAEFKIATKLIFSGGVFLPNFDALTKDLPGGGTLMLTPAQIKLLQDSTYSQDIGGLMGQINEVGTLVANLVGKAATSNPAAQKALQAYMGGDEYLTAMVSVLGGNVDADNLATEYVTLLNGLTQKEALNKLAKEAGKEVDEINPTDDEYIERYNTLKAEMSQEIQKNLLVLSIAQSAATQSKDGAMKIINSTTPKKDLLDAMSGTSTTASGMGDAALVYGAFTAYAMSSSATEVAKSAIANDTDPTAVFDVLDNPDELKKFQAYMATTQGQTDMDACISSMGVVKGTAADKDAVTGVLTQGFSNDGFISALEELLK